MQKQYAIDALKALKENDLKLKGLEEHGINLTDFTDPLVGMIEMSIATMLCNGSEQALEHILKEISWWAYEPTDKIIHYKDHQQNVESPKDFINWLSEAYKEEVI
jgi:flavodoxin